MKIEIKDGSQTLILTNEELDNSNFVDLELFNEEIKDENNPKGFVAEITVSIEELKLAVDAFWQKRANDILYENRKN